MTEYEKEKIRQMRNQNIHIQNLTTTISNHLMWITSALIILTITNCPLTF